MEALPILIFTVFLAVWYPAAAPEKRGR